MEKLFSPLFFSPALQELSKISSASLEVLGRLYIFKNEWLTSYLKYNIIVLYLKCKGEINKRNRQIFFAIQLLY